MVRFLRGVLAALVSISALAAIGGGWYWHTIHSPVYAVQQIASGLAAHDAGRVHQYLDTRALATQATGQIIDLAIADAAAARDRQGRASSSQDLASMAVGTAVMDRMKPVLATQLSEELDRVIDRPSGDMPPTARRGGLLELADLQKELRADGISVVGLEAMHRTGDSATVAIRLTATELDTTLTLVASLRRRDGAWRVVGLENIAPLMKSLDAIEHERLDAVNAQTIVYLSQTLAIGTLETDIVPSGVMASNLMLRTTVTNTGADPIVDYMLAIKGPGVGGHDFAWLLTPAALPLRLMSGERTTAQQAIRYVPGASDASLIRSQPKAYQITPYRVVFARSAGADTVRVYNSWQELEDWRRAHPGRRSPIR